MQRVLQNFYDMQIQQLGTIWEKRRVRKLCEKGLISATNRRLSLEEEEIKRRFRVSPFLLTELVDMRLLRVEPRLASMYYELSHDSLVIPIWRSQKERSKKRKIPTTMLITVATAFLIYLIIFCINQNNLYYLYEKAEEYLKIGNYVNFNKTIKRIFNLDDMAPGPYIKIGGMLEKYVPEELVLDLTIDLYNGAINRGNYSP